MKPDVGSDAIGKIPVNTQVTIGTDTYNLCADTDQRGAPRPGIGKTACDIGAYETGNAQITLVTPSDNSLNFGTILMGQSPNLPVTVQNTGNSDLVFSDITSDNIKFVAITPDLSDLKAISYRDFNIKYTPTDNITDLGILHINSNDSANNPFNINLSGTGQGFTLPPTVQIQNILDFMNTNVTNNNLGGIGPNSKSASGKLGAFINMIKNAGSLINQGNYANACTQLGDASKKVDGLGNPPDFVGGTKAPDLFAMIQKLMTDLHCS
jgi:hypothetical protein